MERSKEGNNVSKPDQQLDNPLNARAVYRSSSRAQRPKPGSNVSRPGINVSKPCSTSRTGSTDLAAITAHPAKPERFDELGAADQWFARVQGSSGLMTRSSTRRKSESAIAASHRSRVAQPRSIQPPFAARRGCAPPASRALHQRRLRGHAAPVRGSPQPTRSDDRRVAR